MLSNGQLIMLDALAYYSSFSDALKGKAEGDLPAISQIIKTIENDTTCFDGILELSDEELGMNAILDWIKSDSVLSRL